MTYFILVLIWVAAIMAGHFLGKGKGRVGWAWGFLLGWIGVIILACLRPVDAHSERDESSRARQKMQPAVLVWALASAGLMVIGAVGPWVKALGASVGGLDGANDGWLVAGAALVGGLAILAAREGKWASVVAILAGLAGSATTIYDRVHAASAIAEGGPLAQSVVSIGWGLNLAIVASISLTIAALASFARPRDTHDETLAVERPALPVAPVTVPAGWYQDPNDTSMLRYWTGSAWTPHTAKLAG